MQARIPARVLDTSALILLFAGHPHIIDLLEQANADRIVVGIPAACIAAAEAKLGASHGWDAVLLTPRVHALPLEEYGAVEIGGWPGSLGARHAVREARLMGGTVVTRDVYAYRELDVPLLVV